MRCDIAKMKIKNIICVFIENTFVIYCKKFELY